MSQFDDYVQQQAAERQKARDEAAETKRKVDVLNDAQATWAAGVTNTVINPTLEAAVNALKGHAEATSGSAREFGILTAHLQIGKQHAPRQVLLSIKQLGRSFFINITGPGRVPSPEEQVQESELANALNKAVREAIDRYFGTNDHKHS